MAHDEMVTWALFALGSAVFASLIALLSLRELGFVCLSDLATGGSWLCYFKALQDGPVRAVVPIDKMSILVTVLFARLAFHERLSQTASLGLACFVSGTLLMF